MSVGDHAFFARRAALIAFKQLRILVRGEVFKVAA